LCTLRLNIAEEKMKTRSIILTVLLAIGVESAHLIACGDKFLVSARGTRFQRAAVPREPATILVFADPASNLPRSFDSGSLEQTLRAAGYRPTIIASSEELDRALRLGRWDLILLDATQTDRVSTRLDRDSAPAPVLLSVLYKPTGAEWKSATKRFEAVMKSPAKNRVLIDSVDDALAVKASAKAHTQAPGKITS